MRLPMFQSLVVELQSNCNRACPWCMRQGDTQGRRLKAGKPVLSKMPTEHATRILDEASSMGFRNQVTFYLMSEPYLDARLIDMARYAKSLGMVPYVNTNGDVLRNRPDLVTASLEVFSWIEVAIYEPDPAVVKKEIEWWRARLGKKGRFKPQSKMGPRPHLPDSGTPLPTTKCHRVGEKLIVQYDGSAPMCCYDINTELSPSPRRFSLPNAFDVGLSELWFHPFRQHAHGQLSQGRRLDFELCSTCPMPERGYPAPYPTVTP